MTVLPVFRRCVEAIQKGVFIQRESKKDKEFHFQNWFKGRLKESRFHFDAGGKPEVDDEDAED